MNFCKTIFGKDIYELNATDIVNFFEVEREETAYLEFKGGLVEIDKVSNEICAFLNTEGGILIIGAPRETPKKKGKKTRKVCIGELTPSKIFNDKDVLLSKVVSKISPPPTNIKIQGLDHGEGNVFIIEVKQSYTPPHQVNTEGKYYIRLESEAKPAPHGLVEALFFKRQKPKFNVEINIEKKKENKLLYSVIGSNDSNVTIENPSFLLYLHGAKPSEAEEKQLRIRLEDNITAITHFFEPEILVKGFQVDISFLIQPIEQFVFINLLFWCKDIGEVERKCAIYDVNQGKVISRLSSLESDLNFSEKRKEIEKNYKELVSLNA